MIKDRFFFIIGGENIKINVWWFFVYMFLIDFVKVINWIGKGGKMVFFILKIKDVLIGRLIYVLLILIKNNLIFKYLYIWSDFLNVIKKLIFIKRIIYFEFFICSYSLEK